MSETAKWPPAGDRKLPFPQVVHVLDQIVRQQEHIGALRDALKLAREALTKCRFDVLVQSRLEMIDAALKASVAALGEDKPAAPQP